MYWKITFFHKLEGKTSVVVGPFKSLKARNSFRKYWAQELMTPEQSRDYYEKIEFLPKIRLASNEAALLPRDFMGIPEFFRFTMVYHD